MLTEAENALIERVKTSAIGSRLRQVGSLPDLEGESLVKHFATDAPAVYVAPSDRFPVDSGQLDVVFGVACVVRNAAGQAATRKGDGMAVGLYELAEFIAAQLNGYKAGDIPLYVTSIGFMDDDKVFKAGLQVAVIRLEGSVMLGPAVDETALADFLRMNSQIDIEPHEDSEEHDKWSEEPPNHSTSKPDLIDNQELQ